MIVVAFAVVGLLVAAAYVRRRKREGPVYGVEPPEFPKEKLEEPTFDIWMGMPPERRIRIPLVEEAKAIVGEPEAVDAEASRVAAVITEPVYIGKPVSVEKFVIRPMTEAEKERIRMWANSIGPEILLDSLKQKLATTSMGDEEYQHTERLIDLVESMRG